MKFEQAENGKTTYLNVSWVDGNVKITTGEISERAAEQTTHRFTPEQWEEFKTFVERNL
jgi:prepilin-type processing-associated H-X9-DG protein